MDGILIINKPKGRTSHDIVAKVKRIVANKVGHTGTLDPNATGVLPLLIGKGTLCSQYLMEHDKIYEVVLKLGIKTDTADSEGKCVQEKEVSLEQLKEEKVKQTLNNFLGKQEQTPPIYSAIKVNGKKLYEYARQGQIVDIKPREIEIYRCDLKQINVQEKEISFVVHCSKGTYIRSLCEDIAENLGAIGYMKELNRIKVGKFEINQAITVEELENNISNNSFMEEHFISIEKAFEDKKSIILPENRIRHFLNGVKLSFKLEDDLYRIYDKENKFIGIGSIKNQFLKREIILD